MYETGDNVHTIRGDIMNNQELLSALLKITQSGQMEIRRILNTSMDPNLRSTLQAQLKEFDSMETEALTIALQRGWDLRSLDPAIRFLTDKAAQIRQMKGYSDSRIAEIMIHRNTRGMISNLKTLHQYKGQDSQVCILCQKLLDSETAYTRRLQSFL
jgi:hypothetical protein